MAGRGTRLRPFTYTTSKPMMRVAGKPILGHLLDSLSALKIDKTIFIVSEDNADLKKFIKKNYSFDATYILQKDHKGVAHAIYGAKNYANDDETIILFADTLIKADLKRVHNNKDLDGIIWTKQVEDPRSFGVVFTHNGIISKIIEKPETPISDKAIVGLYYFKNSTKLFEAIEHLLKNDIKTKGEFQLTDALQLLVNQDERLIQEDVAIWKDCGTAQNLLETQAYLLEHIKDNKAKTEHSIIIKPVFIEKGARIINSVVGPNVSIGKDSVIESSIVSNSILGRDALIGQSILENSIIGNEARIKGSPRKLNMGDSSEIRET